MLADHKVLLFGSFLLCLSFYRRFRRLRRVWRALGSVPVCFILVSPFEALTTFLPGIPLILGGRNFGWRNVYERQSLPR